jgi:N-acetylneuraminic acid mutarotase
MRKLYFIALAFLLIVISCSKKDPTPTPDNNGNNGSGGTTTKPNEVLAINSFSPATANVGAIVTIKGTAFGVDTNAVSIKFGSMTTGVKPKTITDTAMTVAVPSAAQSGKVQVTISSNTVTSATDFTLNTAILSITNFTPVTAAQGDTITINGTFGTTASYIQVYLPIFGGTLTSAITPIKFTSTQLKAVVPQTSITASTVTGKIRVTDNMPGLALANTFIDSKDNITILPTLFVTQLTPTTARVGEIIEINGHFAPTDDPNSYNVLFAGSKTIVHPLKISIHSNLYVRVPADAVNGKISVTKTSYSAGVTTNLFSILSPLPAIQSGTWTVRPNMGGYDTDGYFGVINDYSFVVGGKAYIGGGGSAGGGFGGSPAYDDLWQFDPQYNSWLQVASFGGGNRTSAVAFAIGTKGYVGGGANETGTPMSDFWQYDPTANTWSQVASFAGGARIEAVGFAIGNYGYVGTGYTGSAYKNDFYKYDPSANSWTSIAPIPGVRRSAFAFSIGNNGYVGGGNSSGSGTTTTATDLYMYDPSANAWTAKASIPNYSYASENSCFVIGNNGYVGLGYNYINGNPSASNLVFQYNSLTNTWTSLPNFGGQARYSGIGFAVGNVGYFGMGVGAFGLTTYTDYWAYTP